MPAVLISFKAHWEGFSIWFKSFQKKKNFKDKKRGNTKIQMIIIYLVFNCRQNWNAFWQIKISFSFSVDCDQQLARDCRLPQNVFLWGKKASQGLFCKLSKSIYFFYYAKSEKDQLFQPLLSYLCFKHWFLFFAYYLWNQLERYHQTEWGGVFCV